MTLSDQYLESIRITVGKVVKFESTNELFRRFLREKVQNQGTVALLFTIV